MKKENLYALGSIVIALVVLGIGMSFAYFTASVSGSGNTSNNETNVTMVSLGEIKYDGDLVFNGTNTYPGYKDIQVFTIGPDVQEGSGIYEIDLEGVLPESFGSDVEITLYKTTNPSTNNLTRTEGTLIKNDSGYIKEDTINMNGTPEVVYQGLLSDNPQIILEQADFTVPGFNETTYYLVYSYKNNGNQDSQQGLGFSGTVTVRYILQKTLFCDTNSTTAACTLLASGETDELKLDGTKDNNLRYVGDTPNNHVTFNGENWRIIGVMNNVVDSTGTSASKLKLIRDDFIGNYSWDSSESSINIGYGVNEWSEADLKTLLNEYYYNAESGHVCFTNNNNTTTACDFSTNGLIDATSKSLIDEVIWNTGTNGTNDYTTNGLPLNYYNYERSSNNGKICTHGENYCNDEVDRTTTWTGKVGVIYLSDFGYATSGGSTVARDTCLATNLTSWNTVPDCLYNNWMNSTSHGQWILTPTALSDRSSHVFCMYVDGNVSNCTAYTSLGIRPVVYLNSNVKITGGDGSSSNPYTLGL